MIVGQKVIIMQEHYTQHIVLSCCNRELIISLALVRDSTSGLGGYWEIGFLGDAFEVLKDEGILDETRGCVGLWYFDQDPDGSKALRIFAEICAKAETKITLPELIVFSEDLSVKANKRYGFR
jgi:hypothetical protein